jgi:hypothetical protein
VLALKLVLAPALIGLATLAARRWGPAAAGWAASLPVVGGPVLLVVALDHGRDFGARAAAAATVGLVSLVVFAAVYERLASTGVAWWAALPCGWLAFLTSTLLLSLVTVPVVAAVLAVIAAGAVVRRPAGPPSASPGSGRRLPGDLAVRMVAGAALVVVLSAASAALGARLTGLLTPFPVIASVLAAFTHAVDGAAAVRRYADALVRGLPSFAAFTAVVGWSIRDLGVAGAFSLATLTAVLSHVTLITRPWRRLVTRMSSA